MKLILKTIPGLEPIVIQETKSYKPKKILPRTIQIETNNLEKIKKLRSITKAFVLIKKFKFKNKSDIIKKELNLKKYLKNSFIVRCSRRGNHNFNSLEIEKEVGEKIFKKYKLKVDFKNPETIIYIEIIDNLCLIGINPIDLSKRNYKVKITPQTLNSTIAYSLLKFAKWKPKEILLDPFCKSGDILIEAALSTNKKINIYAIDKNTKAVEINSKLAKVKINIKKSELDWIDTLFKKESIDKIITSPPIITKLNKNETIKEIKEFFNQAHYILKKSGNITLITTTPKYIEEYIKEYKFKINKKYYITHGELKYTIMIMKK